MKQNDIISIIQDNYISEYYSNNSTIENSNDNWYYDRLPDESFYDYVQNSCNKSESYIRTFKNHSCDRPLFSFVLEDQLE